MKLTVFKAADGDSVLIEGSQANILVDGGRSGTFKDHVAPTLEELADDGKKLDLVCVSHIDDDHITGIVELFRRRREWVVHEHMITPGPNGEAPNPNHPPPKFGKPPAIRNLWHNGFEETFQGSSSPITNQLGFHSQLLSASSALAETAYGLRLGRLAQGARRAIELQLMLEHSPMGVVLNQPAAGELLAVADPAPSVDFSGTTLHLLGPFEDTFPALRKAWDKWVKANQDKVEEMKTKFQAQPGAGTANALDFLAFAAGLAQSGGLDGITPPNLASIMFLVEESGKTLLMTGDGAAPHVTRGLEAHNRLAAAPAGLHVDVLKVPHHGAEANTTEDFARRVTADNYVFCANGRHHNPEVSVIDRYVASRVGPDAVRSPNPEAAGRPFKLWFNYHPSDKAVIKNDNYLAVMNAAKAAVEAHAAAHPGVVDFELSAGDSFTIDLG